MRLRDAIEHAGRTIAGIAPPPRREFRSPMADIFLSYSKADRDFAGDLARVFAAQGWTVWWDKRIEVTSDWARAIETELNDARCVVALWSPSSVESDWVRAEAERARRHGKLVSCIIEATDPPLQFESLQAADLRGWDRSVSSGRCAGLLSAIEKHLGTGQSTGPMRELSGRYELADETWAPSGSVFEMIVGGAPGEVLELVPTGTDEGRFKQYAAGSSFTGSVRVRDNAILFSFDGDDDHVSVSLVQRRTEKELVLAATEEDSENVSYRVTRTWRRTGEAPSTIGKKTRFRLVIRSLAALRSMCREDTVLVAVGVETKWRGTLSSGHECPVGITQDFGASEKITLRVVPCHTTLDEMQRLGRYQFHECETVVTKSDAGRGEQTRAIATDAMEYELTYVVTTAR